MADWGDTPPTFDRSGDAWGARGGGFDIDGEGGGDQYIELIGSNLWVAGMVNLGRFRRVSDFVNIVQGYLVIRDVVVMSRSGDATRLAIPELRVLPDDIAVVAQIGDDLGAGGSGATGSGAGGSGAGGSGAGGGNVGGTGEGGIGGGASDSTLVIEKRRQRLVVMTRSHLIDGDVFIHGDGTIMAFIDATDPKFIPMSDVRVRWMSDRKLAARYPFALLQRSQILGVATEGIKLGGAEQTMRRAALLKAQAKAEVGSEADGLGGDIGTAVPVGDAVAGGAVADDVESTSEGGSPA